MTSSQNRPTHDPNDPRSLLPEWLRDPGEPPLPEAGSNGSPRSPQEMPLSHEREGRPVADTADATHWQQPPAPHAGDYDPSTLIAFDDLPKWMQRLHGGAGTAQLGLDTEVLATPAKAAAVTSSPTVETSLQTLIDPPDEDFVDRSEEHASDLSLAGFAWIAGTAIVLIIAAILVLFG